MKNQNFFVTFLSLVAFRLGGNPGLLGPPTGYAYDCNFNPTCNIKILGVFACMPLCVCQRNTNGSSLHDNAKYVIFLVKVKIVLSRVAESKQNQFESDPNSDSKPFFQFDSNSDSDSLALFLFDSDYRLFKLVKFRLRL